MPVSILYYNLASSRLGSPRTPRREREPRQDSIAARLGRQFFVVRGLRSNRFRTGDVRIVSVSNGRLIRLAGDTVAVNFIVYTHRTRYAACLYRKYGAQPRQDTVVREKYRSRATRCVSFINETPGRGVPRSSRVKMEFLRGTCWMRPLNRRDRMYSALHRRSSHYRASQQHDVCVERCIK